VPFQHDAGAVAEYRGDHLDRYPVRQQLDGESMPEPVRVATLDTCFLEDLGHPSRHFDVTE